MKLELLMTFHAELKPPVEIGNGPYGTRTIFEVTGGTFEGPRLKGTIPTCGGDWILIDAEGVGRLDVRATLETDDGARIYMQYPGVIEMNEEVINVLVEGKGEMQYGDTYFMTQPRFETGDERYSWLNRTMAVAEGRVIPNAVEYQVYALVNG